MSVKSVLVIKSAIDLGMCLCLSANIFPELHVQSPPNYLSLLHVAVAKFFYGGVAICYVLPVFIDDVIFAHDGPRGGISIPMRRVTSLRRSARADAPVA